MRAAQNPTFPSVIGVGFPFALPNLPKLTFPSLVGVGFRRAQPNLPSLKLLPITYYLLQRTSRGFIENTATEVSRDIHRL
jgi:hypothetical protein